MGFHSRIFDKRNRPSRAISSHEMSYVAEHTVREVYVLEERVQLYRM